MECSMTEHTEKIEATCTEEFKIAVRKRAASRDKSIAEHVRDVLWSDIERAEASDDAETVEAGA